MVRLKWSEVCIHTTNEAVEPISNIIHESGAGGVVIEDPLELSKERQSLFGEIYELDPQKYPSEGIFLKAYLPDDGSLNKKVDHLKQRINALSAHHIDLGENIITISQIDEEDWSTAWKAYYKPIKISPKISIVPTWETYEPATRDELIIELDPGMAFGTGTHATTALSIEALEKHLNKNDTVIDVGCGSGILSIAAALLGAKKVLAYDLDKVAVNSTQSNVALNNVSDIIHAKENDLLKGINQKAHIIVANILAEVIVLFIKDAYQNLGKHGLFITSGIITRKKQMVIDELLTNGFQIVEITERDDWVCIISKKI